MTRSRTTERKRSRERQQRRRRLVMLVVAVTTLVAFLAIFLIAANQPTDAPLAEGALERFPPELQSRTTEGYPRFGQSGAPLQVAWYCAFDSLDCAAFHDEVIDQFAEWGRNGDIILTYIPLYGQAGNTQGAARAVVCAAQQQSAWPLISTFFGWRQAYGDIQAFTNNRIISGLDQLPNLNRGAYDACIRSDAPATALVEALNNQRGVTGMIAIPAITVNNVILAGGDANLQLVTPDEVLEALGLMVAGINRPAPAEVPPPTPTATPTAALTPSPVPEAGEATAEATPDATGEADE